MKAIKTIYLAGKIEANDWRHKIVRNLRGAEPQQGNCSYVSNLDAPWPVLSNAIFDRYHYTGPYFISDDHSCFHGDDSHGVGADDAVYDGDAHGPAHNNMVHMRPWVVERCQQAIQRSDLIFAWIDDVTCYGTIAEIGYAKALGKLIWIAGPRGYRDLWFVYQMANEFFRGTHPEPLLFSKLEWYAVRYPSFDSPIEEAFWEAWMLLRESMPPNGEAFCPMLTPQYPVGKYRVDFAFAPMKVAVELDGFASHSSTEDIANDRKRQREIESLGWHVIRFGGKEVHHNAALCVREVHTYLQNHWKERYVAPEPTWDKLPPEPKPNLQNGERYQSGDKVRHDMFGEGIVVKSESEIVEVQFKGSRKRLNLDFVKMEKL